MKDRSSAEPSASSLHGRPVPEGRQGAGRIFRARAAELDRLAAAGQGLGQFADALVVADQQHRADLFRQAAQPLQQASRRRGRGPSPGRSAGPGRPADGPAAPASGGSALPSSTGSNPAAARCGRCDRPWPRRPARRAGSTAGHGRPGPVAPGRFRMAQEENRFHDATPKNPLETDCLVIWHDTVMLRRYRAVNNSESTWTPSTSDTGRGHHGRQSTPLLQPRALLAGLQRARAGGGQQPAPSAAGAAALPVDLGQQPRRILHGPRGRPEAPGARGRARAQPGRPDAGRAARRDQRRRRRPDGATSSASGASCAASCARPASPCSTPASVTDERAAAGSKTSSSTRSSRS